jgi:excisionase family DNA binding protein
MARSREDKARRLLNFSKAADRLDCSSRTIDRYVRAGHLPMVRLPGGHRRIDEQDIEALIASRKVAGR